MGRHEPETDCALAAPPVYSLAMRKLDRLAVVAMVVAQLGCPGGGLHTADPVQGCRDLCEAACSSFVGPECSPDVTDATNALEECSDDCAGAVECTRAVELGENYDACLDAIDNGDCRDPGGGSLPSVCQGVILLG